jgi:hypothetical protein
MLLNSLQGEIAHMNTLSNDFYSGFKTGTVVVGTHHYPFYTEFTEAEQSFIWPKPNPEIKPRFDKPFEPKRASQSINGVQGTLF